MIVVALLSVIVLGLMSMFTQTQRAFRLGMSQTDVLESGRMATDLVARELEQITPAGFCRTNGLASAPGVDPAFSWNQTAPNYYSGVVGASKQVLPWGGAPNTLFRTNILDDVFFVVRQNQTWSGIGYFVRTNQVLDASLPGGVGPVGTLFRFETNNTVDQYQRNPSDMFARFLDAANQINVSTNVSKLLEGVVHFRVRPVDNRGWVLPDNPSYLPNWPFAAFTNLPCVTRSNLFIDFYQVYMPNAARFCNDYGLYEFFSNATPASVEFEIGILEQQAYERYKSIPIDVRRLDYMTNQAQRTHIFRQRIAIHNVDPSAYQ